MKKEVADIVYKIIRCEEVVLKHKSKETYSYKMNEYKDRFIINDDFTNFFGLCSHIEYRLKLGYRL